MKATQLLLFGARTCVATATALVGFLWIGAHSAVAIPSLTPHPHVNPGITDQDTTWLRVPEEIPDPDPDSPDMRLHQHRDRDPLIGGNGKYIANKVWDNNQYRLQEEFGHGFQAEPAKYTFAAAVPAAAQTDFNAAVNQWETAVNGNEINVNGVPILIKMDYLQTTGDHEIDVFWANLGVGTVCSDATACWIPGDTDFYFDSNPTNGLRPGAGQVSISLSATGPFLPSIDMPNSWYFGGAGAVGTTTTQYWQADAAGTITGPYSSTYNQYDFYTIALHELGHSWGLMHFAGGIMREDISSFVMRSPDAGSIDGMKDLYAIPIPEPASCLILLTAVWCVGAKTTTVRRR